MFYLILKYAFLFALAALFGFLFGRWWSRRTFVDITHDYVVLSRTAAAPWDKVWKRFDAVESSVSDVGKDLPAGLEVLQGNLANMVEQRVSTVRERLDDLDNHVRAQPAVAPLDFAPLQQRLAAVEQALREIPRPDGAVDLGPLENRLSTLSSALAESKLVDLAPLEQRIGSMEQALRGLTLPEKAQAPELAPLQRRIEVLEKALRSMQPDSAVDAESIDARLTRIERSLAALSQTAPRTPAVAREIRKPARQTTAAGESATNLSGSAPNNAAGLRLLESAQFGERDNLKQISGIGPKIERMLNQRGIYYFWQVADWSAAQIRAMDELLAAFQGRIERDNWVAQARQLVNSGKAAARPRD